MSRLLGILIYAAVALVGGASAFFSPSSTSTITSYSSIEHQPKILSSTTNLQAKARGEGYGPILDNISETVGNTPLVKISNRISPPGRTIYAKCEFFNPLSSVKDRLALSIIEAAERDGTLKPGQTVIEATSGNTGIAVAMMCAQRGYPCVITMAEPFSVERRKLMRMLGAKVIVTPKAGKGTGMVEKAKELSEKHGWFLCHQFETEANWKFHYETTGPEIYNDLQGKLDYWVTGYGTGGTFHGTAKYLKEKIPNAKIILAEPGQANLVGSRITTERNADGSPAGSHPAFAAHPIQGWTPDFIPLVLEQGLGLQDDMIEIPDGAGVTMSQTLARNEGILTGISGGATMWAAVETAKKAPEGSVLVAMLPDTGERYLSTPLFASIEAEMNEEELEIARSTPNFILEPSPLVHSFSDAARLKKAGAGVTSVSPGKLSVYDPNKGGLLQGTNDLMERIKSGASFGTPSPSTPLQPAEKAVTTSHPKPQGAFSTFTTNLTNLVSGGSASGASRSNSQY